MPSVMVNMIESVCVLAFDTFKGNVYDLHAGVPCGCIEHIYHKDMLIVFHAECTKIKNLQFITKEISCASL